MFEGTKETKGHPEHTLRAGECRVAQLNFRNRQTEDVGRQRHPREAKIRESGSSTARFDGADLVQDEPALPPTDIPAEPPQPTSSSTASSSTTPAAARPPPAEEHAPAGGRRQRRAE